MATATVQGQSLQEPRHSVARQWNEALLYAIRRDFARPTVHARNLFHTSAAMFDAWAVFDADATMYFLDRELSNGSRCLFSETQRQNYRQSAPDEETREQRVGEVISLLMYRLLSHRFANSPGFFESKNYFDNLLATSSMDAADTSTDIDNASTAALANYLAQCVIDFGLADGSNEAGDYANSHYTPVNASLNPAFNGNETLADPNRWQPLRLDTFIDQSGNPTDTPLFLGAEWGDVIPFSLVLSDMRVYERGSNNFSVYLDPGAPALTGASSAHASEYLWGHALVALWSSHLDPDDGVVWDISPGSIGNSAPLPIDIASLPDFYNSLQGGSSESGHALNPATGQAYAENLVPRGDYTRVLAEFWADGPDSETPPGHWFSIYNEAVADHPQFERRFNGSGPVLSALEFDVKTYLILGAAMHDAAIVAWSIKGWYDYIRPVSALRFMAEQGTEQRCVCSQLPYAGCAAG